MIKLLMSWDILPNKEREFLDFLLQEFTPALQKVGLQPTDAWLTVYGDGPQVLAGGMGQGRSHSRFSRVSSSSKRVLTRLSSDSWSAINRP